MRISAAEISSVIEKQIEEYRKKADISEVGEVIQVGDGIARIYGLENAMASELIEFPHNVMGMVLNLEEDNVGCILFGSDTLIKEGDVVKQGQTLFRFDQTKARAGFKEAAARAAALKAVVARLKAETFGGKPAFPPELNLFRVFRKDQLALFNKRQSAIQDELSILEQSLDLVKKELDMNLPLLRRGDVSRAEILKLKRQVTEIKGQITNRKNKYLQDCQAELAKSQEDLAAADQVLAQRREQLKFTELVSPMDGVVRNIRLTTRGGVAKPGEEIMQIVPVDDDLIIEAKVRPADIAFVKQGLPATVKMDAYDYSIYGSLFGAVHYISADTLKEEVRGTEQPFYRVQVKISSNDLPGKKGRDARISVQTGMTATVEIKTGTNTVLGFLTKPITKTMSESFSER